MTHISNLSGGRDSTAMTVRLLELGYPLDHIIFCDTLWEFPEMYEYLNKLDSYLKRKFNKSIIRLSPKESLEDLMAKPFKGGKHDGKPHGLPYSIGMSYCTRELKVNSAKRFIKSLNLSYSDVTCYVGYVAREKRRSKINSNEWNVSYPLIDWNWNEEEVTNYLKERSIYNHLYDNFSRTGCFICPKQNLQSWKTLCNKYPNLWQKAKDLEALAVKLGAVNTTLRADGTYLYQIEKDFINDQSQSNFSFDWNDENVSCFCK